MEEQQVNTIDKERIIINRLEEAELFTKRFGSFSKSDYEILMFSIYRDLQMKPCRDYEMSLALGITESKIRSLRVKSQLCYPKELDWKDELCNALNKGNLGSNDLTITIMIEDPSIHNLLKNKIEETYGTVRLSLNSKLMTLPVESYLLLAMELEEDKEAALQKLNQKWQQDNKDAGEITKETLKKRIWNKTKDITSMQGLVKTAKLVLPAAAPFLDIIEALLS